MSYVTNVILSFSILENEEACLKEVNIYFPAQELPFKKLQDYAGSKFLEQPTFIGAFNYLGTEEFIEHVRKVHWKFPKLVQLFICDQEDEQYMERLQPK